VTNSDFDKLLSRARNAEPDLRIELRDPVAARGARAIDAMTDWLGDPRLAAFAIRVLERIGRDEANKAAVVAALRAVDREDLPDHLGRDLDAALAGLGVTVRARRDPRVPAPPPAASATPVSVVVTPG
jgi:hypothetical protein